MLNEDLERHISLRHLLGFKFRSQAIILRNFVAFAERRGDQVIKTDSILAWAVEAPSPGQRRRRLLEVRRFAIAMKAEDDRHEVPPADALGRVALARRIPYIYTQNEILALVTAARTLGPANTIRPLTFATLFGLLAATGMRISEALTLRVNDITEDGLLIENTKFKKSRLLPLHSTTRQALDAYLQARLNQANSTNALFVGARGEAVPYTTAMSVFLKLARSIGLRGVTGVGPRIHDLRHTFAVRSLETCDGKVEAVSRHIVGLSTYLGHVCVTGTYWYLHASPSLMVQIAEAGEALQLEQQQ
jgi:integrase